MWRNLKAISFLEKQISQQLRLVYACIIHNFHSAFLFCIFVVLLVLLDAFFFACFFRLHISCGLCGLKGSNPFQFGASLDLRLDLNIQFLKFHGT